MGKSASAPPAPDYIGAAKQQGESNIEAARVGARLSNPNIISPYGNQTVSYGTPTFDQAGYDKAMAAYKGGTSGNGQPQYIFTPPSMENNFEGQQILNPNYVGPTQGGTAPTREQFTTVANQDTPNVTQTLNPESQQIFDTQQQTKLGLSDLANQGISSVRGTLGTPFSYNGPKIQTQLPSGGEISQGPSADQYGLAGGIAGDQYGQARGINGDQYGQASGIGGDQYGSATGQLDLSQIAKMPVNAGMTGQNALMARLQPQIERERQQYETQLRNQGLVAGGEAYNNGMTIQNQKENDLRSQAALYGINLDLGANQQGYNQALQSGQFGNQAIAQNFSQGLAGQQQKNQAIGQNFGQGLAGQQLANQAIGQNFGQGVTAQQLSNQAIGQNYNQGMQSAAFGNNAQNQRYNQGLQSAQFGNTAQQQDLQQQLYMRNLPLNEISALTSGSQIQNPQFMGYQGANVVAPNYQNAAAQQADYAKGLYGLEQGTNNANTAGAAALGGAALSSVGTWGPWLAAMSDRRLKSNIERIGTHPLGIGIYEYDIFGEHDRGVMADEVMTVKPEAVLTHPSGYLMVDYGRL